MVISLQKLLILAFSVLAAVQGTMSTFDIDGFLKSIQSPQLWNVTETYLDSGPMVETIMKNDVFMTIIDIYNSSATLWPEVVKRPFSIGKTFKGNDMYAIAVTLREGDLDDAEAILIDSLHHGREMLSVSMFIPAVNVDALLTLKNGLIDNIHSRDSARKNYNRADCKKSPDLGGGVDLNRNYDEHFGLDEIGSHSNPCNDQYRGPHPFSESETQAIRDFVIAHKHIRIAFNFHAYGNMWIRPVNYDKSRTNEILNKMYKEISIYKEFDKEATFVKGSTYINMIITFFCLGNSMETLGRIPGYGSIYLANGEATDWMLLKRRIIAMSPEIGADQMQTFYPDKKWILPSIRDNYPPVQHMMRKILFEPRLNSSMFVVNKMKSKVLNKLDEALIRKEDRGKVRVVSFEVFNRGIGSIKPNELKSSLDFSVFSANSESVEFLSAFSIDCDDNYRQEALTNGSVEQFVTKLLEFKVSMHKIAQLAQPTNQPFLNKLKQNTITTHRLPFNSKMEGRTYRRYFIIFKPTSYEGYSGYQVNVNITTTLNHDDNLASFLLSQNIRSDNDQERKETIIGQEDEIDEDDDADQTSDKEVTEFLKMCFVIGGMLAAMVIVIKCIKRRREKELITLTSDMTDSNIIEIN